MLKPLIELKGISKTFGKNKVLDNIDLQIYQGDAIGIIGPSGTGKSTILRIIAGLLQPDQGDIYIQGQKRNGLIEDGADPVSIGMVFQQAALFDSLNVDENVGFSLYQNSKLERAHIHQLVNEKLEMVGLPEIGHLYPSELSGGMRKRVSFARAIMSNPDHPTDSSEVLLYDEPTAGLDPIASTVIEDLIRSLQCTQGVCSTYCIVTHQESTIRRTADKLIFLYQGKVQWQGKVSEIEHTDNPLIRQFMSGSIHGPIQVVG
ncbi:MAG: ATP-binding cassette domain-containing protein [Nostocales cyanobacterium]|nr:MAG: ATP-binding cassette domain-containing protein [Nostocales cyanobacterium]